MAEAVYMTTHEQHVLSSLVKAERKKKMEQTTIDKFKQFVVDHKKEIIYLSTAVLFYRIGFNKGVKTTENAVIHFCNEISKTPASGVNA